MTSSFTKICVQASIKSINTVNTCMLFIGLVSILPIGIYCVLPIVLSNVALSYLFYIDKQYAIANKSRVSEAKLLLWSVLSSHLLTVYLQSFFRHKSSKLKFNLKLLTLHVFHLMALILVFGYSLIITK